MKPAELKHIPFSKCYKKCELVKMLGVGECENCCPEKFDDKGKPLEMLDEKK